MRHYKKGRKLGTDTAHTRAMKKSLVGALLENDRIKTTETRAKEIRPDVDRIITWAKRGDLHARRLAIAKVGDQELVRELFEKVQQGMFADRPGGYTRIYKLGPRNGDKAPMVIMELVTEPVKFKESKAPEAPGVSGKAAAETSDAEKGAKAAVAKLEAAEESAKAAEAAANAEVADETGDCEAFDAAKTEEAEAVAEAERLEAKAEGAEDAGKAAE